MPNKKLRVSIGMPIYRGHLYVAQAIQSILSQTWQNFEVLMSVDNNDLKSAKICQQFLSDPRFKLHIHQAHLGWVKNINWLMKQQTGKYWCYHQQDDLMKSSYIEKLLRHAQEHPEAAVVYSDIQCFGEITETIHQESVKGAATDREINLIRNYYNAVAIRGLIRRDVILGSRGIRDNNLNGFSSDTTWMTTIARFGELHRIPEVLYKKRYHSGNIHSRWGKQNPSQLEHAWMIHCRDMFLEAIPVADTLPKKYQIFKSILYRLLRSPLAWIYIIPGRWNRFKKAKYVVRFIWLLILSGADGNRTRYLLRDRET